MNWWYRWQGSVDLVLQGGAWRGLEDIYNALHYFSTSSSMQNCSVIVLSGLFFISCPEINSAELLNSSEWAQQSLSFMRGAGSVDLRCLCCSICSVPWTVKTRPDESILLTNWTFTTSFWLAYCLTLKHHHYRQRLWSWDNTFCTSKEKYSAFNCIFWSVNTL